MTPTQTTTRSVPPADRLVTSEEAADRLGIRMDTLRNWRARRHGPPFIRISPRSVKYSAAAVEAWITAREVRPLDAA